MFNKVLISDDLGSINQGVLSVLDNLGIKNVHQVQYCDDAFLKIKKAVLDDAPFDLLITDLSFIVDHRSQRFNSGSELIQALRKEYPYLKIIVYSVEDRLQRVRLLMNDYKANAYVCKGRRGLIEIENAIHTVFNGDCYLSPQIEQALSPKANLELDDFDIHLIQLLSEGLSQDDISAALKKENFSPCSLSSIEKRLNKLRVQFKANNAIHLIAIVKDLGLI
ncbi:response regulator transcription factor [Bizionia gelidisalsuginis]|uniref:Response regulator transcription factor n=2 Tax=Bizionia TaxID=283785 RepID=A0A8H2LEL8_9FLAO|nr:MULTISPECIES: response regulator transcription factor [Bizionia]TYB74481.1 response regulator transcription factor [Bizionia saleffrena]TYC16276.1 response regulator transcription factor [Bizionia gelidisalsuginis]